MQLVVEPILVYKEIVVYRAIVECAFAQGTNVATGTKGFLASAAHDDSVNRIVRRPMRKQGRHCQNHLVRERVECLWPVKRQVRNAISDVDSDFAVGV